MENIMTYYPQKDYYVGKQSRLPEVVITGKKKKPYWVSPKGAGNMTVMPGDPEMVFFAPIVAGAAVAASPTLTGIVSNIATPGSAFWTNPITKMVVPATGASKGFNALANFAGGYNSWGEGAGDAIKNLTGWNPYNNGWLGQFAMESTNPAFLMNPAKVTNAVGSAVKGTSGNVSKSMGAPQKLLRTAYEIATRKPIPLSDKQAAAKRMTDFIHEDKYVSRLKNIGLSDNEIADYQNMIARRLNNGNFPAYYANLKSNVMGHSLVLPKPLGGIYINKKISPDNFLNVFDHELAHYSTVNFGKGDNSYLSLLNRENPTTVENIMKYNIGITPYRPESDALKVRDARGLNTKADWLTVPSNQRKLNYFRDEQELRSNGYATILEARRRGISTDELVDKYTMESTDEIVAHAPKVLKYLNYAYTPEKMKTFLKELLSITPLVAPKIIVEGDGNKE